MITKMNKKSSKLLAAVAVLAMVACAFVVTVPTDDVSGEGTLEAGNIVLNKATVLFYETNGATITFTGYVGYNSADLEFADNGLFAGVKDCAYIGYNLPANTTYVKQVNSQLSVAYPDDFANGIKEKSDYNLSAVDTYNFLIPVGGIVELYYGTSSTTATKVVFDFTDVGSAKYVETLTTTTLTEDLIVGTTTTVTANTTYDLGSYVLACNNTTFVANGGDLTIKATTGGVMSNGVIAWTNINKVSSLTIDGGSYVTSSWAIVAYASDADNGTSVSINNATIVGKIAGVWFGNGPTDEVEITNTTIYGGRVALYLGTAKEATISGCYIESGQNRTPVEIKAGTITIDGGTQIVGHGYEASKGVPASSGAGDGVAPININNGYATRYSDDKVEVILKDVSISNTYDECLIQINAGSNQTGSITLTTDTQYEYTQMNIVKAGGGNITINNGKDVPAQEVTKADNDSSIDASAGGIIIVESSTATGTLEVSNNTQIIYQNTTVNRDFNVGDSGSSIVIINGTYNGTVSNTDDDGNTHTAKAVGLKGDFILKKGSNVLTGTITAGKIESVGGEFKMYDLKVTNGATLEIQVTANATITMDNVTIDNGATIVFNNMNATNISASVKVGEDAGIVVDGTLTLMAGVKMSNDGEITGKGNLDVREDAQFYSGSSVGVSIIGNGDIILEDAMETLKISDKLASNVMTDPTQKVIITGNLTIKSGQYLIVRGELEVPAGVSITIEEGGLLVLVGASAKADIAGEIKSTGQYTGSLGTYAGFTITGTTADNINVSGTITAAKATADNVVAVNIDGVMNLDGKLVVKTKAGATFGGIIVTEDGSVEIDGIFSGDIETAGAVVINGSISGSASVYISAPTATINVVSLKVGTLTITDDDMYLKSANGNKVYVGDSSGSALYDYEANYITLTNVKGLTVTEAIVYETFNKERAPQNYMYINGALTTDDSKVAVVPMLTVADGSRVVASETLSVTKMVMNIAAGATLTVSGEMYVSSDDLSDSNAVSPYDVTALEIETAGVLNVVGLLTVVGTEISEDNPGSVINAVMYEKTVEAITTYYYTNLKDAIASGETELKVLGDLLIIEDTTIPAGIEIEANDISVGNTTYPNVTLTVADGGFLSADQVDVVGTLVIENTDSGDEITEIISDTSSIGESDAMYTNLYNALSNAGEGDVVTITKDGEKVYIDKDVTISVGVTLEIKNGKEISVMNGVTLTVAGILENKGTVSSHAYDDSGALTTSNGFNTAALVKGTNDKYYSVIVVTGEIVSYTEMQYTDYVISGAYYEAKGKFYITTVGAASEVITTVDGDTIDIYGANSVGDVSFIGTANEPVFVNVNGNKIAGEKDATLTAGTITISYGELNVALDVGINAIIANGNGSVQFQNVTSSAALVLEDVTVTENDADKQLLFVSGGVDSTDNTKSDVPAVTFSGAVGVGTTPTDVFSADLEYTVKGESKNGAITVAQGANVTIDGGKILTKYTDETEVIIDGTLVTVNDGTLEAYVAIINGTLTVKEKGTTYNSDGTAKITNLYLGGTTADVKPYATGAGATLNTEASATVGLLYLFPGNTVTGKVYDQMTGENAVYTEFYVEDALWMTVYDLGNTGTMIASTSSSNDTTYNFIPESLEDCKFSAWTNENGENVTTGAIGSVDKVIAKIDYVIYDVYVYAQAGINAVYIDGDMMVRGSDYTGTGNIMAQNVFYMKVAAGTHTITYTLENGYSGEAYLIIDNVKVSGMQFSCSGVEDEDLESKMYLQGVDKSGYTPEAEKSSGMSLTEILLIVLVVLIAVMAIVIAMRMMRS